MEATNCHVQVRTRNTSFEACIGFELKYKNSFPFFQAIPMELNQIFVMKPGHHSGLILKLLLTLIRTSFKPLHSYVFVHFQACPTVEFSYARNNVYLHVVM
ncbi:hypothetical protein EUGRSUZ_E03039 [Eucalyptus grandis]|uniref:Uncharacterized protein n=2 Tax=Eucalyptus grandis TaxID=71139 RepID=A0ACC3L0B1_EUCGR|nr:hypothetical protein EUGRSUZ_E03039 [Eucalyptus grandis]